MTEDFYLRRLTFRATVESRYRRTEVATGGLKLLPKERKDGIRVYMYPSVVLRCYKRQCDATQRIVNRPIDSDFSLSFRSSALGYCA